MHTHLEAIRTSWSEGRSRWEHSTYKETSQIIKSGFTNIVGREKHNNSLAGYIDEEQQHVSVLLVDCTVQQIEQLSRLVQWKWRPRFLAFFFWLLRKGNLDRSNSNRGSKWVMIGIKGCFKKLIYYIQLVGFLHVTFRKLIYYIQVRS